MSDKRDEDEQASLTGYIFLGAGAVATGLLTDLTSQLLGESYGKSGAVQWVGFGVTFLLLVILTLQLVFRYRRARRRKLQTSSELHAAAEAAEQWMIALGSDAGGMAAAEWFTLNEDWLRELLATEKPAHETLDDFARICDALEAWYVRRPDPDALLHLSDLLSAAAEACGRRGLAELAAARAATAYRMLGDLDTASTKLGISDNIATHGRTAAALKMRRQVERALLHLATAERAPAGSDRDEAVLNARDRLDDARLSRPGPDLAADVAISINLAVVQLYQHDSQGALDHLRPAHARATAAGDVSGEAHALELIGVAAWMQRNPHEAVSRWEHAAHLYAEIDEREGHARCLQHLGSAQVAAGNLDAALELLEQSARLRTSESEILTRYLDAARKTSEPPVVDDDQPRRTAAGWLKRLRALFSR
ncbi:tetratricopeptide repeat protein [Kribbella sp. HUAS MG21]|uniref:Tetratricopeptide repeat protein n=1 Tax=Kribbella sp. HUAS MG21 TaxID=3160966 RepID=A0AAU7TMA4_9ACTN